LNETFPPKAISASRGGRCGAASLALRLGASLSVAAGAFFLGWPAGGTTDIGARLIAQWLSERLGQPFIVENRPGAGTHAATEAVVRARPDGYTLFMATGSNAINATLYDKMKL
jgi:tripartite-type tricarboxylate transporter receptor subunit TctC